MPANALTVGLLHHIIDCVRDAIMVIEPSALNLVDANRNTCQLLGYEREELIGHPVSMVECSLQDLFFWEELQLAGHFDGVRIIESEWLAKDGTSFPIEKRVTSYFDGTATYWTIQVKDLTRRRRVEEEQILLTSQLQTSLEATAEGIMVVDLNGNIVNINRRFAELWRLPDEVLASRGETQVMQHLMTGLNNRQAFSEKLATLHENAEIETDDVLSLADGRYIVCVSKPQFRRDRLMGRVFSFRDITAMKQAESELVAARDAAEQASRVKSQFLSQMSHELRTPLNSIIGFAQLLEMESDESTREHLATISRAGRHLLNVINEILDLAKIEAERIEIERLPFSPTQILLDLAALIEIQVRDKGLRFAIHYDFPMPSTIHNDPTRFRQILLNLCTNALKYTEQGSIELHVRCEGESLSVTVADTGIGISEVQQKRLFAAFSQADSSTTRRYGGTGLGLYISHQLAQLLGGAISVESKPGVGSRFRVSIATGPLAGVAMFHSIEDIQATIAHNEVPTEIVALRGSVLLAEDGIDNQRLFCAYMRKAGLSVTVVENGSQAIEQALGGDFDLVLMDMQMPVMGGLEATSLLRQAAYDTPIVALTANVMKEDVESYLAAGCSDHFSKPIDRDKFFRMLGKYLAPSNGDTVSDKDAPSFGDMDFYQELVEKFIAGLPETLGEMQGATALRDWVTLGRIAHTLKGTAGNFGYAGMTALADSVIKTIRGGQGDSAIGAAFAQLEQAIEEAMALRQSEK